LEQWSLGIRLVLWVSMLLVRALRRKRQEFGLAFVCIGGGSGIAVVVRIDPVNLSFGWRSGIGLNQAESSIS
jgi:Thiolase, C-terminal domain